MKHFRLMSVLVCCFKNYDCFTYISSKLFVRSSIFIFIYLVPPIISDIAPFLRFFFDLLIPRIWFLSLIFQALSNASLVVFLVHCFTFPYSSRIDPFSRTSFSSKEINENISKYSSGNIARNIVRQISW